MARLIAGRSRSAETEALLLSLDSGASQHAKATNAAAVTSKGARRSVPASTARLAVMVRPLGRSARPLPHVCRPFVSYDCPRVRPAPKVQPSTTSRPRCNPKERHHERHSASPLQLHHVSRHGLHLRLPASRRTNLLRQRPAVPVRRAMPVQHAVQLRRRHQLRPVLNRLAPTRRRRQACSFRRRLTSRVDLAPLPHEGTRP